MTIPSEITSPDVILNEGQGAPYTGVLTNEKTYRFYRKEVEKNKLLEKQLKDLDIVCAPPESNDNTLILIGLGLLSGIAAGYYIGHAK